MHAPQALAAQRHVAPSRNVATSRARVRSRVSVLRAMRSDGPMRDTARAAEALRVARLAASACTRGDTITVVVAGGAGSGKTPFSHWLARQCESMGCAQVSTAGVSACLRRYHGSDPVVARCMRRGLPVPPRIVRSAVSSAVRHILSADQRTPDQYRRRGRVLILDGAPRSLADSRDLPVVLARLGAPVRAVVWMQATDAEMIAYMARRARWPDDVDARAVATRVSLVPAQRRAARLMADLAGAPLCIVRGSDAAALARTE